MLGEVRLPQRLHQLSIRHVAANAAGLVAVAMQYEGSKRDQVPLVGLHNGSGENRLLQAPPEILRRMRQYTGVIAFDPAGELLAVRARAATSSPSGTRKPVSSCNRSRRPTAAA